MRCKKHPTDISSSVGVCASCLRERLLALLAAQAEAQVQAQRAQEDHHRISDTNPPPLIFPRSVSPYISRRKSDTAAADVTSGTWHQQQCRRSNLGLPDARFFSTPLVGPTGEIIEYKKKKKFRGFSLLSNLFKSKPGNPDMGSDPGHTRVVDSRDSTSSSSSPAWFSTILPGRKQKQTRMLSLEESAIREQRRPRRKNDRGMSPAIYSNDEGENNEHCHAGSSGYSSESSQGWKQTPRRTPATAAGRGARQSHGRNMSGIAFCLSPLVRASPSWHWNQKGVPPEVVVSGGDIRLPEKPRLSAASFICKNRSRKLADFGRFNDNR